MTRSGHQRSVTRQPAATLPTGVWRPLGFRDAWLLTTDDSFLVIFGRYKLPSKRSSLHWESTSGIALRSGRPSMMPAARTEPTAATGVLDLPLDREAHSLTRGDELIKPRMRQGGDISWRRLSTVLPAEAIPASRALATRAWASMRRVRPVPPSSRTA